MLSTKLFKYSAIYSIAGMLVMGCQHTPPPVVEAPQFPTSIYPMVIKGQIFTIDAPWDDNQDLQQQQDALFTSANEYETEGQSIHKYVNVEKVSGNVSQYILKSGLQMDTLQHNFDTFLQFTIQANCKQLQNKLHCQYNAIDGLYSVDLPASMSSKTPQTSEQMEQNEIAILSKLMTHPFKISETFKVSLPLAKLKTKLVKQHFLVDSKKSNLYLSRLQYNYEVALSQEQIEKQYFLTASYYINPLSVDSYHADYDTPLKLAKEDFKQALKK
jgi:hypothetical protein